MTAPVFVTRHGPKDGLDFFPTPPWATRAITEAHPFEGSIWEPACGHYHLSNVLKEHNDDVTATDIIHGDDFFTMDMRADWIVTNPPFNVAEDFLWHALEQSDRGVAFLVRINFLASKARYDRIYSKVPPAKIFQFTERVQFNPDRVARKGANAVDYTWIIWDKQHVGPTEFHWIGPCRSRLERDEDYGE